MFRKMLIIIAGICLLTIHTEASQTELIFGAGFDTKFIDGTGDLYYWQSTGIYPSDAVKRTANFSVTNSSGNLDNPGLGWKNKSIWGIQPFIGIQSSADFALIIAVTKYINKKGKLSSNYNTEYSHLSIQTYAHLKKFIIGLEINKINIKYIDLENTTNINESSSIRLGLVTGLGIRERLTNNLSLVIKATYSFAGYSGEYYPVESIKIKFNVGGFNLNAGLQIAI